jgi:CyaY protein
VVAGTAPAGADAADGAGGRVSGPFWPHAPIASKQHVASATIIKRRGRRLPGLRRCRDWGNATLGEAISGILSIMSAEPSRPSLTDGEYQTLTQSLLEAIESQADQWLQLDVIDIDTHRTGGLLELSFPSGSKIIVNTQPPLHEVWLAAKAGGFHFRWVDGQWRDTRDGTEFIECLSRQASAQAGRPLRFQGD